MILKHFLMYGDEDTRDIKSNLSFQTRCITKLYEKVFIKKYRTENCKQLNFFCGNYNEFRINECIDGFYDVQVPYDVQQFFSLSDEAKRVQTLNLLLESIMFVANEMNWNTQPFLEAYHKVKELKGINDFRWGKFIKSPDGKNKAYVWCVHDLYDFKINIIVKNEKNKIILQKEVISTLPDELIYLRFLGNLEWVDEKTIILRESYSKGFVTVELPE